MLPISTPEGERLKELTLVRSLNPLKDEVTIKPARGDGLPDRTTDRWTDRNPAAGEAARCAGLGLGCVSSLSSQTTSLTQADGRGVPKFQLMESWAERKAPVASRVVFALCFLNIIQFVIS